MHREPDSELAQLDTGLALEDFAVPDEIKQEFARYEADDIWAMIDQARWLDRSVKIRAGFAFMALKDRLKGNFKTAVCERDGRAGYYAAWRCMCYARAALHLPEVAQQLGFRCIKKALALPPAQLQEIQEQITGIPAEIAKAITEEAIDAKREEILRKKRSRAVARKLTAKERAKEEKWLSFSERTLFDEWYDDMVAVLGRGATVPITEQDRKKISELKLLPKLGDQYREMIENLSPVKEILARAETVGPSAERR